MEKDEQNRVAEADTGIISGLAALVGCLFFLFDLEPAILSSRIGFALSLFSSAIQIYFAYNGNLEGRNWSNFFNALISIFLSISLFLGFGDESAIGGFLAVGLLSIKYWWATSRRLNHKQ